jgi:hypothetical protein
MGRRQLVVRRLVADGSIGVSVGVTDHGAAHAGGKKQLLSKKLRVRLTAQPFDDHSEPDVIGVGI